MCRFYLREAKWEDSGLLYGWVNEPECRKNSFHSQIISLMEHEVWLKKKLEDKNCHIYIAYTGENPTGQIRLEIEEGKGIISYSVDKAYRGQGYGSKLLEELRKMHPGMTLIGKVKCSNIASQRIFEKAGYKRQEEDGFFIYTLEGGQENHGK